MILLVTVEDLKPGNIQGQSIVRGVAEGRTVVFDVIKDTMEVKKGDRLEMHIMDKKPKDLEEFEFCGHGYLIAQEEKFNETIISLWGIIFKFHPPLGLEMEKKYYICIKHVSQTSS
ncbi:MAG: DNA-directed RNA polymerase subunit G [Acidilobaceae archaeon]|nr:DNA-directed RNA polymerase subunit G [Acidilobaceae archaeon]MCX8165662.1 DNA-directed RNA polymerase subunit G [Acidilobaceae archaeon]MDW7974087.1 DNA-directed RNA polymerase subunit G [Sulfolobales archaeon]